MDRIEEKPKFAFLGNSHMAFWALDIYFPQWECLNYGAPGEGLAYVESFAVDVFNRLLQDGRLNPELTLDDLHLNGKGYSILTEALKQASGL